MNILPLETRKQVIEILVEKMKTYYIFLDKALKFEIYIHQKVEAGQYNQEMDTQNFAESLTTDLQEAVGDRHLRVNYLPEFYESLLAKKDEPEAEPSDEEMAKWEKLSRYRNHHFQRVERLHGNVGYILLNGFEYPFYGGATAEAALAFVADCDALIFDLRKNGGGAPEMVQLICSYLFAHSKHIDNWYNRSKDETEQFRTQVWVHGKKMPKIPVYILTSPRTFSAAEEFSYSLKALKRATIVGETTGGGAHPTSPEALSDGFVMSLCKARGINPVTGTNWEGTGVEPDIQVPQAEALATAHLHALESLLEKSQSEEERAKWQWELDNVRAVYAPKTVPPEHLQKLEGRYGAYLIHGQDAELHYTFRGFPGKLTAISEHCFVDLEKSDGMRFEFVQTNGSSTALRLSFRDEPEVINFPKLELVN